MTIILTAAIALAALQTDRPPPVISISPSAVPTAPRPGQTLLRWVMSPVICRDGGAQPPVVQSPPRRMGFAYRIGPPAPVALDFSIDASGRPLSITRRASAYAPNADDVVPAFAATRFAPGAVRHGCVVTYTGDVMPLAAAPMDEVMALFMLPGNRLSRAVWDRIHAGGDCGDPAPAALLRGYPDFKAMPDQPGYPSWTMIGYDIDRKGRPQHLRTAGGSGSPDLDRAGRSAAARSRFERGAHGGCMSGYFKSPTILPAPPAPEEADWRPANATCPREHQWERPPQLVYPGNYQARSIEGWAMVTFDVAPWGEIGNVHARKAEPTADFGTAAERIVRGAAFKSGGPGYVGCVERVRYLIRKPGMAAAGETPPVAND